MSASATAVWSGGVVLAAESEVTIVRVRGIFRCYLNVAAAVGDGFEGAIGLALVTDEAAAVGATAIPGPLSNEEWDGWMFHHYFDVRTHTTTIADGVNSVGSMFDINIDSKAMRKWNSEQTMVGMIQVVESGTASIVVHARTRMLLKLS